jgi:hypothetical protein
MRRQSREITLERAAESVDLRSNDRVAVHRASPAPMSIWPA